MVGLGLGLSVDVRGYCLVHCVIVLVDGSASGSGTFVGFVRFVIVAKVGVYGMLFEVIYKQGLFFEDGVGLTHRGQDGCWIVGGGYIVHGSWEF